MTNIKVVIGSNFGDEGKGLMTDYFCHQATSKKENCIVVMSNGGAQRGHTVVDPSGVRHIFKHFGSGTLAGADTYCADDFILNPMTFRQEYDDIISIGCNPKIYVNYGCIWTTPYDMIINQIVEETREEKKHGSCGMGIWETIYRHQSKPCFYTLGVFAMCSNDVQVSYLKSIRDNYMLDRLNEYGIKSIPDSWRDIAYSENLINNFINDIKFMVNHVMFTNDSILSKYHNVIFENGQGLLLDQNQTLYGDNTTPSNTGIMNPLKVINRTFNKANLEVCYVTRTYLTRHGAGRFDEECNKSSINRSMNDETNQTNQFQGHLRYGELILKDLVDRVETDLKHLYGSKFDWTASFGVTHTNEKQFDYEFLKRDSISNIYLSDRRDRDSVTKLK